MALDVVPNVEAKIVGEDTGASFWFGFSVALQGSRAVAGTYLGDAPDHPGYAYVLDAADKGFWSQSAVLTALDGVGGDNLGVSVAVDGDRVVVGADRDDDQGEDAGSAYVFERSDEGVWRQTAKLQGDKVMAHDKFGVLVAVEGSRIVVGSGDIGGNPDGPGAVFVFEQAGDGAWSQAARLLAPDGANGDHYGFAFSLEGDRLAVGADYHDEAAPDAGAVYVLDRQPDGTWAQSAKLVAADAAEDDRFGFAVALEGPLLAVSAHEADAGGTQSGAVYVFEQHAAGAWVQVAKLTAQDAAPFDFFGAAVALQETTLLVGADADDDAGPESGAVYTFAPDADGAWRQVAKMVPSDGEPGDHFGVSVAMDGTRALVGSYLDDDVANNAGAAYVYRLDAENRAPQAVIEAPDTAECTGAGTPVGLDASASSDADGHALAFRWSASGVEFDDAASVTPTGTFPLGSTLVTLAVTDPVGASGVATRAVVVQDTTGPHIAFTRPAAGTTYVNDEPVPHGLQGSPMVALGRLTLEIDVVDACDEVVRVDVSSTTGAEATMSAPPYRFVSDPSVAESGEIQVTVDAWDARGLSSHETIRFFQLGTKLA